jgi:hypothetical protein
MIYESDESAGVQPFYDSKGYRLSIIGDLPGVVRKVEGGKLLKAVTNKNENLLPRDPYRRRIHAARLSNKGSILVFEVNLERPKDNKQWIKELSGELTYMVSREIKPVDLGVSDLKAGVKGSRFGAEITRAGQSKSPPHIYEVGLRLKADKDEIKEIRFVDGKGNDLSKLQKGYTSMGTGTQFTYHFQFSKRLPPGTRIVVEMHEAPERFTIPFKLENISLLGTPLP